MKTNKILATMAGVMLAALATGCDEEKDLIIIDGNLPIKTSTLYMVGDATPCGWSIDSPEPFTATADDALVFEWEGTLYEGEIKLCLSGGSWDNPFIRPLENQRAINSEDITNEKFQMHAGDPDEKWRVKLAGKYRLTFNMRDWCYSTTYLGATEGPTVEPIETDVMYLVGDAVPAGWNIDAPTELAKTADYTFVFEGVLKSKEVTKDEGAFKGYIETGNWGAKAIRPAVGGTTISKEGVSDDNLVFSGSPDDKWQVTETGLYRVTFDLKNWKVSAEYLGEAPDEPEPDPLLSANEVYMVGDATPGAWDWGSCLVASKKGDHVFSWTGELAKGSIKASVAKNYDAGTCFIRPDEPDVEIGVNGVAKSMFVFTTDPDDKWMVTAAGYYTLTFDLSNCTIEAKYHGTSEPELPAIEPLETDVLYMLGDATLCGWNEGNPQAITKVGDHLFVYEGYMNAGEMKGLIKVGMSWSQEFLHPEGGNVEFGHGGLTDSKFAYYAGGDDFKWIVTEAGNYRLTFDLANWTLSAEYLSQYEGKTLYSTLYMIGEATDGGWDLGMDNITVCTRDASNPFLFTWTGHLKTDTFKACSVRDYGKPFFRPTSANVEVGENGVADPAMVYTDSPDDQWKVTKEGTYTLTFDLEHMTISAKYIN